MKQRTCKLPIEIMDDGEDNRREAAIASAACLRPNFKSKSITKDQISKFQELHRRRLQIKAKSKEKKETKGKIVKYEEKNFKEQDCATEDTTPDDSSTPKSEIQSTNNTAKEQARAATVSKKRQKLHWGLDVKERWEMKANM